MPSLKITTYGNPILRRKVKPITKIDSGLKKLAKDMLEVMHKADGIGLAAPQIGKSISIFVADISPIQEEMAPMIFLNIEILESFGSSPYNEGCLSIPGVVAEVIRPEKIRIRYMDLSGRHHEGMAEGVLARVIQHETDHLNGKLFIDYLSEETLEPFQAILKDLEQKNKKLVAKKKTAKTFTH
ncbi:peptide deformylase [bacterium]|nr:MAG: peptide deformylase [bacterium]